jgi:hypothetical protein
MRRGGKHRKHPREGSVCPHRMSYISEKRGIAERDSDKGRGKKEGKRES